MGWIPAAEVAIVSRSSGGLSFRSPRAPGGAGVGDVWRRLWRQQAAETSKATDKSGEREEGGVPLRQGAMVISESIFHSFQEFFWLRYVWSSGCFYAVEKDPFPTQLFTASVFRSAVLMLIDSWLIFLRGLWEYRRRVLRDCQHFKK